MSRFLLLPLFLFFAMDAAATVRGRVISDDGSPVEAARVRVFAIESSDEWMTRILSESPEPVPLATVATTANGTFSIETKANPSVMMVVDNGSQVEQLHTAGEESGRTIALTSEVKRGRVLSEGKPVPNVLVTHGRLLVTRTDGEGAFAVSQSAAGEFVAIAPGYAVGTAAPGKAERGDAVEIVLHRGVALRGQVLAADGTTPVADAVISVNGFPIGRSSQDGTFSIANAPPKWRTVSASAANRVAIATRSASPAYLLRLRPAATLSGTVRSSQDDSPVGGARVFVNAPDVSQRWAVTDAKGRFALPGLSAGSYRVSPSRVGFSAGMAPEFRLLEGARSNRLLVLHPMSRLTGQVVDEEKKPVAAAELSMGGDRARTGPDGTFDLLFQPMSVGRMVTVRKPGYAPAIAGPFNAGAKSRSVNIVLTRGINFRLRLVDRSGAAVANEPVTISVPNDEEYRQSDTYVCRPPECRTNADGILESRLLAGMYEVAVGGETVPVVRSRQVVSADTASTTITVDRGSIITGRVVAAEGSTLPESGLFVRAKEHPLSDSLPGIFVAADGSFVIRSAPAGRVTLFVFQAAGQEASGPELAVEAPATGVELKAPKLYRIEGRVIDRESGQPVTEFTISERRYRGGAYTASPRPFRSDHGRFTIEGAMATSVDLMVSAPGYAPAVMSGLAPEAGREPVEVKLERGGSVAGRVTRGGRPVPEANVIVVTEARLPAGGPSRSMTDGAGEFTIEGLGVGDYLLQVNGRGLLATRKAVEVTVGRETRIEIEIAEGKELSGRVVDEAGRPVSRARVHSRAPGGGMIFPVESDADGAFKLEALTGNRVSVIAEKSGYISGTAENVDLSAAASVTITLERGGRISGQVRGLSESEIAMVRIHANGSNGTRTAARPDPSGEFTLNGIADGPVMVRAVLNGPTERSAQKTVDVSGGTGPRVDLEFANTMTVRGRITRAGAPLPLASISFQALKRSATAGHPRAQANADGMYEARFAEAGEYRIHVETGAGGTVDAGTISISGPTTHDIDLRGSSLRGRVVDSATNAALAGVMVSASRLEGRGSLNATTDSDGRFAFDAVPAGKYRFSTSKQRYMNALEVIDVREEGTPDIELRLREGDRVIVRVIDAETRRPVESVSLTITDSVKQTLYSGMPFREEDGGFRVWLVPGRYTARVYSPQYVSSTVELSVPGAGTIVTLSRAGRIVLQGRREGGVRVRLVDPNSGRTIHQTSIPPGVFESVTPGMYKLEIMDDKQNVVATFNVTVAAGQTVTVPVG